MLPNEPLGNRAPAKGLRVSLGNKMVLGLERRSLQSRLRVEPPQQESRASLFRTMVDLDRHEAHLFTQWCERLRYASVSNLCAVM